MSEWQQKGIPQTIAKYTKTIYAPKNKTKKFCTHAPPKKTKNKKNTYVPLKMDAPLPTYLPKN